MKEKTRNFLAGLTVLVGLALLGAMILIFQELPGFLQVGYKLQIHFWAAGRLEPGSDVLLAGQRIGRVTDIDFTDGDSRKGVNVTVLINSDVDVPGNVNAYLAGRSFGGGMVIDLRTPGKDRLGPDGKPLEWLPRDGSAVIEGKPAASSGFLPAQMTQDISAAAKAIARLSDKLEAFLTPPAAASQPTPTTGPAEPAEPHTIFTTLAKLNRALDAFNKTLGDPENQANIKSSLAKLDSALGSFNDAAQAARDAMVDVRKMVATAKGTLADISGAAKGSAKRFDDLAGKLMDDADQLNKVLTSLHRTAVKLEGSEGSAGKLLNDPKLYNGLVDATDQLTKTLEELSTLLADWKANGVKMKLK